MVDMQNKGFVYEVKIQLLLAIAEVAILMDLSSYHYDGRCKAAGAVGGFIYGMSNKVEWAREDGSDIPSLLTWSQVDTMCKILEQAREDEAYSLAWEMKTLLRVMSDEQRKMNNLP